MGDVNLILDKFYFEPKAAKTVVELRGRPRGIVAFFLKRLGIAKQSYLIVTREEVQFRFVFLGGITTILCPLDTITSVFVGVSKPMWALWLGIFFIILAPTIILPIIGIILLVYFYRTKLLTMTFSTGDMLALHGLDFAVNTADGQAITLETLLSVAHYINTVLLNVRPDSILESASNEAWSAPSDENDEPLIETPPPNFSEIFQQTKNGAKQGIQKAVVISKALLNKIEESTQTSPKPVASPTPEPQENPSKQLANEKYQESVKIYRQGHFEEALVLLQEANLLTPNTPRILNAIKSLEEKLKSAAQTQIEEPVAIEPETPIIPTQANNSNAAWQTGEIKVLDSTGLTGELDPNSIELRDKLIRGRKHFREGNYSEALKFLEQAEMIDPYNKDVKMGIIRCKEKLNQ